MVIPIEEFAELREKKLKGKKIVATCGFFDPMHPGHASIITESKKYGDVLVVILNGDQQCITKKGKAFMPATDRADIIDNFKGVDYVVMYDHPTEYSSLGAIEVIRPDVLTKGGDRNPDDANNPESPLYKEMKFIESYGGRVEFGVGKDKVWSSSDYLEEWYQFRKSEEESN